MSTKTLSKSVVRDALKIAGQPYRNLKGFAGYAFSKCSRGIQVSVGQYLDDLDISKGRLLLDDWDGFICFKTQKLFDLHSGEQIAI